MDRFEAIEVLKDLLDGDTYQGDMIMMETPHEDAALKMAIEALEIGMSDEFRKLKEKQIMYQQCIEELFLFVENITERAIKNDLSLFRCPGAGGCDMYQGMPPICRKKDDILHRYEEVIDEAIKTQN